jgi:hypothetical protein
MLPGEEAPMLEDGRGISLAYPLAAGAVDVGDVGNDEAVRTLLYEQLSAMRAEQQEAQPGALAEATLPVPNRSSVEASLRQRGYRVRGNVALRRRPGLFGGLLREKVEIPPAGTTTEFLRLARLALGEVPSWPTPRAMAVRGALDLGEVSWEAELPSGIELLAGQSVELVGGSLTSHPPRRLAAKKSGRARQVQTSYREVGFRVDPAFTRRTRRMELKYEYLDVATDEEASIAASYDAPGDPNKHAHGPAFTGTGEWVWASATVKDAELRGRGAGGSDLRIKFATLEPLKLRRIVLTRLPEPEPGTNAGAAKPAPTAAAESPPTLARARTEKKPQRRGGRRGRARRVARPAGP